MMLIVNAFTTYFRRQIISMRFILFFLAISSFIDLYGASEKYRLIWVNDPSTTVTIGWNQISGENPTVHYGTEDFGTDAEAYPLQHGIDRETSFRGMNNHFARLSGLAPNTIYYFVISDSEGTSERFWFRTAPADNSRLKFISGGDSRNNQTPRRNANRLVAKLKPHGVIFSGDMTDDDTNAEWDDWFEDWQLTISSDGQLFPIIPARGNHEDSDVVYNLFDTTPEEYYAITFGENLMHVMTLNTNISVFGNQRDWLVNELENSQDIIWRVPQYHKPMRPHTASKPEGITMYFSWAELFYQYQVKLAIEGDSHMSKHTFPIRPTDILGGDPGDEGFVIDEENGTTYVGEGCWGAPLRDADDDKSWTCASGSFNQFKLLYVDEDVIEMRTILVDNAEEVGEVSYDDYWALPENLDVWAPDCGEVLYVYPADPLNPLSIQFAEGTPLLYEDGTDLNFELEVQSPGEGINQIEFSIDGTLVETDTEAPYGFTTSLDPGQYLIEAEASDAANQFETATLNITVGNFDGSGTAVIAQGEDDVEETEAGLLYIDSSDLELVYDGHDEFNDEENGFQTIGLRFAEVCIPPGSTVTSAILRFTADESDNENAQLRIRLEDSGNAEPFESGLNEVTGRNFVTGEVQWIPPAWDEDDSNSDQESPALEVLLQQVVDRVDWQGCNAMVFAIDGIGVSSSNEDSRRTAESFEGGAPAELIYSYSFSTTDIPGNSQDVSPIHIIPNPSSGEIFLQHNLKEAFTVEVFAMNGKLIERRGIAAGDSGERLRFSLSEAGTYLIALTNETGVIRVEKAVVLR